MLNRPCFSACHKESGPSKPVTCHLASQKVTFSSSQSECLGKGRITQQGACLQPSS